MEIVNMKAEDIWAKEKLLRNILVNHIWRLSAPQQTYLYVLMYRGDSIYAYVLQSHLESGIFVGSRGVCVTLLPLCKLLEH